MHCLESTNPELELLIGRCLRGDDAAWGAMFERYHPKLLTCIRLLIHRDAPGDLAEEIAAAVWCSLCEGAYMRLRRYDASAGGFTRYLAILARGEVWRRRRADRSRLSRESRAARKESADDECGRGLIIEEFLATLTPREREFCRAQLFYRGASPAGCEFSVANGWQLRHRVMKKFQIYLNENL